MKKTTPSPMSAQGTTLENPKRELTDQPLPTKTHTLTAEMAHLLQEGMDFQATLKRSNMGLHPNPPTLQKAILDYLPSKKTII